MMLPQTFRKLPNQTQTAMRSNDECYITALSTELIYSILDFIPYESHLDFACTCKRLADCSSNILKRHQEASNKYRVASDISPTTIPTLLRSVFGFTDPLLAWHVRSLEIWYDRTSWLDWKPLHFDQPLHEEDKDVENTSWKWQDGEIERYLEAFDDQFIAVFQSSAENVFEDVRDQFADGFDGIAKALLIAHCPKLQGITFITHENKEQSTLSWVKKIVHGNMEHGGHWLPGLCSIKDVAVGVESETWTTTTRHTEDDSNQLDGSNKSMEFFSALLRLPRINSIYYNGLRTSQDDDQTDYESDTLMPSGASTVKHIFLDDCDHMQPSFLCALSSAPRALETFTLRAGNSGHRMDDADQLVSGLSDEQGKSLQTLMFYGPYTWETIHGYRCSVYRNEELDKARKLRTVAINISDVELDCFYSMSDETRTQEQCREYFIKWFRETAFPPYVERIVFWGLADECYIPLCEGKFLDWLEDALIHVIQSWGSVESREENYQEEEGHGRKDCEEEDHEEEDQEDEDQEDENQEDDDLEEEDQEEEDQDDEDQDDEDQESCDELSNPYESFMGNLRAIHLEEIERQYISGHTHAHTNQPQTEKIFFRRLVEAAQEANVDVHTLTNRAPARHTPDFPTAPDKYDLRSGPWWERRDEIKEWVFDVYQGRRVPLGCGKCGKCEQCLHWYDEALWRSLDE
jgi:hypothetical protein